MDGASAEMKTGEEAGPRTREPREDWLDALRGLAVLGMIETHTVNTMLAEGARAGQGFTRLMYTDGLVAPAFLWIAGYAHGVVTNRKPGQGVWPMRTVRRLGVILFLAYLIHLPVPGTGATWRQFFGVDVLQCLAASLLMVVAVQRWLPRHAEWALAGATAVIIALGALPPAALIFGTGFWPLEAWLDQSGVSLFPLVPWAAFVFLGVLLARWRLAAWMWVVLGLGLLALPSPPFISKSHPTFFAERFGWLLLAAAAVRGLGQVLSYPRWLRWVGRESLALYLAHLALLYLVPTARWVGPRLSPVATGVAAFGLAVVSAGLVLAWRWVEARRREAAAAGGMGRAFSP